MKWLIFLDFLNWFWTIPWAKILPIGISVVALWITLHDRRPKLVLRRRAGEWCVVQQGSMGNSITGVVEVYNLSSRATAINAYHFWQKMGDGTWKKMESEYYKETGTTGGKAIEYVCNLTPVTIAPYLGAELRIRAMTCDQEFRDLNIRIGIEDIFGNHSRIEMIATKTR